MSGQGLHSQERGLDLVTTRDTSQKIQNIKKQLFENTGTRIEFESSENAVQRIKELEVQDECPAFIAATGELVQAIIAHESGKLSEWIIRNVYSSAFQR